MTGVAHAEDTAEDDKTACLTKESSEKAAIAFATGGEEAIDEYVLHSNGICFNGKAMVFTEEEEDTFAVVTETSQMRIGYVVVIRDGVVYYAIFAKRKGVKQWYI